MAKYTQRGAGHLSKPVFFLIIVISALLEVTILDYIKVFNIKPDLLLVCVVLASLTFDLKWAVVYSIFAGILKDAFASSGFGLNTFLFTLWCFLIVKLSKKITLDNNLLRIALLVIIVFLHNIIYGLALVYAGNFIPIGIFLRIIVFAPAYTALILALVLKLNKAILP